MKNLILFSFTIFLFSCQNESKLEISPLQQNQIGSNNSRVQATIKTNIYINYNDEGATFLRPVKLKVWYFPINHSGNIDPANLPIQHNLFTKTTYSDLDNKTYRLQLNQGYKIFIEHYFYLATGTPLIYYTTFINPVNSADINISQNVDSWRTFQGK